MVSITLPQYPPPTDVDCWGELRCAYGIMGDVMQRSKVGGSHDSSHVRVPRPVYIAIREWWHSIPGDIVRPAEIADIGECPLVSAAACDLRDAAVAVVTDADDKLSKQAYLVDRELVDSLAHAVAKFRSVTR